MASISHSKRVVIVIMFLVFKKAETKLMDSALGLYQQHYEMTYKIFIFFLYISSKIESVAMAMHYILDII
jgi:hypothetical protein